MMRRMTRIHWVTLAAAALAGAGISGCGDAGATPSPVDSEAVRDVLSQVLTSWKAGDPHTAPAGATPPIRVADEEWLAGAHLVDFVLGDESKTLKTGGAMQWPVTLTVRDARGKTVKRPVTYLVTAAPERSVIRQD